MRREIGAAAIALQWLVALAVLSVGVAGLLHDSELQAATTWVNVRTLFGALLLLSVVAKFAWQIGHAALQSRAAITAFARGLSRQLYVLLYLLAGIKELQFFLLSKPGVTLAESMRALQSYLAYGLLALAVIWILAALCRHFADAAASVGPIATESSAVLAELVQTEL